MKEKQTYKIAIVGNPNCGKSSVFNQLTGLRQKVSNFPGVTVDKKMGSLKFPDGKAATLIDFPGTYSLYPTSKDERVVLDVFTDPQNLDFPDLVLYIADVNHIEKHILLLTQILDLGVPVVLGINMIDTIDRKGIDVDVSYISRTYNIRTVAISGRFGTNIELLKQEIHKALLSEEEERSPIYELNNRERKVVRRLRNELDIQDDEYRLLLLAHHHKRLSHINPDISRVIENIVQFESFESLKFQIRETMERFRIFGSVAQKTVYKSTESGTNVTDRIDRILTHKVFGPLIFFLIMLLVFQAIFAWATYPMDLIADFFGLIHQGLDTIMPQGWVTDLITDGVLSGLNGILVFIPQIALLFLIVSILEETGYMARAVFIFDRVMQKF